MRWFVTTVITVVSQGFKYLAESLTAWYVALIRCGCSVCIVDKATTQGIIAGAWSEIGTHIVFNLEPTTTIVSEQSIWEIIQS